MKKKLAKHSACLERPKLKMFGVTETIQQRLLPGLGGDSFPPDGARSWALSWALFERWSGRLRWLPRCWVAECNCRILQISTEEILHDYVFLGTMTGNNPSSLFLSGVFLEKHVATSSLMKPWLPGGFPVFLSFWDHLFLLDPSNVVQAHHTCRSLEPP